MRVACPNCAEPFGSMREFITHLTRKAQCLALYSATRK